MATTKNPATTTETTTRPRWTGLVALDDGRTERWEADSLDALCSLVEASDGACLVEVVRVWPATEAAA